MNFDKFPTNGPVDAWVFMPVGRRLGRVLHACGLTPNAVTTLSLLAGLLALLCAWRDNAPAAMALLVGFYVLDCADGVMARTFGLCSDLGEVYDYLKDAGLFCAFAVVMTVKVGAWLAPAVACLGLYLLAWEGAMNCRAFRPLHGSYDFYSDKVQRRLCRPYLLLMWLCYRIGRPMVHWPLHWFGTGEVIVLALFLLYAAPAAMPEGAVASSETTCVRAGEVQRFQDAFQTAPGDRVGQ